MALQTKNIQLLTSNFNKYLDDYYSKELGFPNTSCYFHMKVISIIRASKYEDLFDKTSFFEYIYATLATWGMDRLGGGPRLVKFDEFSNQIVNNKERFIELSKFKLNEIKDSEQEFIIKKLAILFDNLKIMLNEKKLVGVSKLIHHLLPDLVPPIDGKYTLSLFYGNNNYNSQNEKEKFLEIFKQFIIICKTLNLTKDDLIRNWDTSIPKLIDNAIVGFGNKQS